MHLSSFTFHATSHPLGKQAAADETVKGCVSSGTSDFPQPGNFRELECSLVRMLIAAKSSLLLPSHALSVLSTFAAPPDMSSPAKSNLKASQGKLIMEMYQRCHGNVVHTARELSVSRNTVYRELRRSGLR
jgi:transcriptional regulator of acetoin/glycerol metabolism